MQTPVICIEEAYTRKLEHLLDDASITCLLDDRTNVKAILGKVTYLVAFYHRNIRMFSCIDNDYIRRMRMVNRLFIAYQEGVMD